MCAVGFAARTFPDWGKSARIFPYWADSARSFPFQITGARLVVHAHDPGSIICNEKWMHVSITSLMQAGALGREDIRADSASWREG